MKNYFRKDFKEQSSHAGFVVPLCSLMALVFFIMTSFVIDIGNARYQLRTIQIAADAASLAAITVLGNSTNYTKVRNEVWDMAGRNGVTNAEVTLIRCGTWTAGAFTPQAANTCTSAATAVEVTITRSVNTFFGTVMNVTSLTPKVESTASTTPAKECARPFGISRSLIYGLGLTPPFEVTLSTDDYANGNWGKLDIGDTPPGQFSMKNDLCDENVGIGEQIYPQPGNSNKTDDAFNALSSTERLNMVFALTSPYDSGHSSPVDILEFAKVDFIRTNTTNGSGFTITLRITQLNVSPNPNIANPIRILVK